MWSNKLKISSPLVIVRIMVILVTGIFLSSFLYNSALARERDREDVDLFKFGFYLSPVGFSDKLNKPDGSILTFYNFSWEPQYMITNTLEWKIVEVGLVFNAENIEPGLEESGQPVFVVPGALGVSVGTGLTENLNLNRQFSIYMGPELSTTLYLTKFPGVTKTDGVLTNQGSEANFTALNPAAEDVKVPPFPRSGSFLELNPFTAANYKEIVGFPFLNTPLDIFAVFGADYFPLEGDFSINSELNIGFRSWVAPQ